MNQYDSDEFHQRIMNDHSHLKLNHVGRQISKRKNIKYFVNYLKKRKQTSFGSQVAINWPNDSGWALNVKPSARVFPFLPLTA